MKTIHKYPLSNITTKVSTYEGVKFLHVAEQRGQITAWAEVNTMERECMSTIHIVPTGGEVPRHAMHVGSLLSGDDNFVWHIYADSTPTPATTEENPDD